MDILKQQFKERIQTHQLIAAIKEPKAIEKAIKYKDNISAVILMTGNILTVKQYVDVLQDAGLPVILHVEKVGGLQATDTYGIDFVAQTIQPFGIVTTKANIIKKAKAKGLYVIQRVFLIDTEVYVQLENSIEHAQSDMIELMPCRAPDFLRKLTNSTTKPIITGGLLTTIEHAKEALVHGAKAVTTSNTDLWKMKINEL